jgi:adenylyltransferase/sulfurtransferase
LLTGGQAQLSGVLLFVDLQNIDFNKIQIPRDDQCPVCGAGEDNHAFSEEAPFEEVCSRDGRRSFFFTPAQSLELDLSSLSRRLEDEGLSIIQAGRLAVTFETSDGVNVSLTASGGMIVQYPPTEDKGIGGKVKKLCRWVIKDLAETDDPAFESLAS